MDFEEACRLVDARQDRLIELFRRIIGIDTTVPPGNSYGTLVSALEGDFHKLGFSTERVLVPEEEWRQIPYPLEGDRINLVARRGTGQRPVTIYSHMDVVPAGEGWDVDPLGGVIKDGKIYGRGAGDMKGTIASLLVALEVMQESGLPSRFDINVTLCTDEEIGVYPGVYYLARKGYIPDGPIICMEGVQEPFEPIAMAGGIDAAIHVTGRSCHSGMNFLGVNAIEEAVPILDELMALKRIVEKRESAVPTMKIPGGPSDKMTPMFNIDIIRGGEKSNVVPSSCDIIVNRRTIPEESYEQATTEIREAVERGKARSKALAVDTTFTQLYPPLRVNPDTEDARKLRKAVALVQGYRESDFHQLGGSGSTDMAFVQEVLHTDNIVVRGAGRADSNFHSKNEFVYLKDLAALAKELIYFLTQ